MTNHSALQSTFTLERTYSATPERVFAAWASPEEKRAWFAGNAAEHSLDFRVGGKEINTGGNKPDDPVLTFESTYHDIVQNERIVFTSVLLKDQTVVTVSLTTVELVPEEERTRLIFTQQGTFLDGHEQPAWREQGTSTQLDALAENL